MTNKDIFKLWSPPDAKWTDWIRPVPFVAIENIKQINNTYNFTISKINYITKLESDTAIILDLPGYDSIVEGITLAKLGFRPIPLFNGTNEQLGAMALVDNHGIENALIWGALELKNIKLNNDTSPVFLLDSNRTHQFKMNVSIFDNSWDLYDQDIPSAKYFMTNGIKKVIVRGEKIQKDLINILYKFQKKGIIIFFTNGYQNPKEITIKKPRKSK